MRNKTLNRTSLPPGTPGLEVFGDPNAWKLLCKVSCIKEGWMKSTKAMEIPGVGCLVQVTTQQLGRDGVHAVAEAIVAIPYVMIDTVFDLDGNVVGRRLVSPDEIAREEPEGSPGRLVGDPIDTDVAENAEVSGEGADVRDDEAAIDEWKVEEDTQEAEEAKDDEATDREPARGKSTKARKAKSK